MNKMIILLAGEPEERELPVSRVDAALYKAKKTGKNKVVVL